MTNYTEVANTLYPNDNWGNYDPIINWLGTVAISAEIGSCEGETLILFSDAGKGFGYLNVGWGSCCACDALLACGSREEVGNLIAELEMSIKWLPREEMLKFFREHDWKGDYSFGNEQQAFVRDVIQHLEQ